MPVNPEFILPFGGRNFSGTYDHNILWRFGSAYIMDNHGAALWCWLQHIDDVSKYELLHIDQHYDCLSSQIDEWLKALPPSLGRLTFEEYRHLSYLCPPLDGLGNTPIVRFDNYLSIFLKRYASSINKCAFATHRKGDRPSWDNKTEVADFELVSYVSHSLDEGNWIVNVDLDYFFYTNYKNECRRLHADAYVEELFDGIATKYKAGKIAVITLCLSPETCGGWEPAETLAYRICGALDLPFQPLQ